MLRLFFLVGTTTFWITMMSLLIHKEFFELAPVETPYDILPLHNLNLREEYRAIYLGAERIGFNFTVLEIPEKTDKFAYELRHQTYLSFLFLGKEREMLVRGTAHLDSRLNLQSFDVRVSSGDYWTQINGQVSKDNLNLVIEGKEGEPVRKIMPTKGQVIFSEALNFIWTPENLKIGKQGKIQIWNPLLMNFEDIDFRVSHKENIPYQGRNVQAVVVYFSQNGIDTRTWITPEGMVLRQESPTGLVTKKEDGWQIFDSMRNSRAELPDLPNLFSIPSNQTIQNPETLRILHLRVTTPEYDKTVTIHKEDFQDIENIPWPFPIQPAELAPYLEATPWIQSRDPEIVTQAKQIVGDDKTALGASLKLMHWVHQNVSPIPTVSLPSARQVLAVKKGDCNEYTVLFTALARALGIPTKMGAGLVYQQGRFFYHAWPQVYLGRWIGLDPTFDQAPVDATHIPLVEGDLEGQIALVKKIGQIKILILEQS